MRFRELVNPSIYVALTNEEAAFLRKNKGQERIDLHSLSDREIRVAENLIIKDVLCKLTDTQLMVNSHVGPKTQRNS
jgi:hypothetical protein